MTTPSTRRQFLATLGAVAVAPLVVHVAAKQTPASEPDLKVTTYPLDSKVRYAPGLIKVPSNRVPYYTLPAGDAPDHHRYYGDWDGTFKLEHGCTNPAFVLADLYERTGKCPDWVVADVGGTPVSCMTPRLNWQMLVDWGMWCDEQVVMGDHMVRYPGGATTWWGRGPRFTVTMEATSRDDLESARQVLRMHCLRWQSTDPRYRTSYPVHV